MDVLWPLTITETKQDENMNMTVAISHVTKKQWYFLGTIAGTVLFTLGWKLQSRQMHQYATKPDTCLLSKCTKMYDQVIPKKYGDINITEM